MAVPSASHNAGAHRDNLTARSWRPRQAGTADSNDELVAEGREARLVGYCATCHGQNGEGIETVNGNHLGPSLAGVGAAAVDFQVGTGRMPMSQPGSRTR